MLVRFGNFGPPKGKGNPTDKVPTVVIFLQFRDPIMSAIKTEPRFSL